MSERAGVRCVIGIWLSRSEFEIGIVLVEVEEVARQRLRR